MQQHKAPSPEAIFDFVSAYQKTAVLRGAIELEFFTAIAEGNTTPKTLAARCKASERGVRILADFLCVMGLVTKTNGTYGLTADTAVFLDKRSPAYVGDVTKFMTAAEMTHAFDDIAATVRKGGTVISAEGTVSYENPVWIEFARSMGALMFPAAQALPEIAGAAAAPKWKVLDIAAGHGLFGIMMAVKNPNAEIVALDWPKVLDVAEENAKKHGVANRWKKLPGDAFTAEFGRDYDLVLLTNFLHHFDPPTNEALLRKVHAALKPGGRAITLEFVPNADRVSPPASAGFSMVMLASTAAGDAYTFDEFDRMFRNAGFKKSEFQQLTGHPEQVIISHA